MPPATRAKNRVMSPEALNVLLGAPKPLTRAEKLIQAVQKRREERAASVYQRDLWAFAGLCYTKDEARSRVAPMPRWDYLEEIGDAILTEPLLMIEKSRRVLASWYTCIVDVWVASGGIDPRWPSLMNGPGNRQVVIASRKLEGPQSSSWFLQNRVKFIVDQLEARGIRDHWPAFPEWEWSHAEARNSIGGKISAIAQGADQARGIAATLFHLEELAHLEQAQATVEAIIPTLFGQDTTGGHLVALCTAKVGGYAADIAMDMLGESVWR